MILEFFEITIKPISGFGTHLKGDTLFGHFCWQASYDPSLVEGGLDKQIKLYKEKPFIIFSSAFPKIMDNSKEYYALKRPDMPLFMLFKPGKSRLENLKQAKENKQKKWMLVEKNSSIDLANVKFITEKQLCEKIENKESEYITKSVSQQHNTINRMTNTTGDNRFAPYSKENIYYKPGTLLSFFVLIDKKATDIERVVKGVQRIGSWGFGRDASTGLGRFQVIGSKKLIKNNDDCKVLYSLAPSVPDTIYIDKIYSSIFTRFGKHGGNLAYSKNPFKNPVIMVDEASVFCMKHLQYKKPYIGCAVSGVSKAMPETVVQGYTPFLPIKLEQNLWV
jgi:CRISPR-associated protein Csm4